MHTPNSQTLPPPAPRALIADDQPDVRTALRLLLRNAGYETQAVGSPVEALEAIRNGAFDLVLIDLNYARDTTSGQEGLDLISNIRKLDSALPIIVLTAWGSVELAVEVMHRGGRDFVQKPWDNSRLLKSLNKQLESGRRKRLRRNIDAETHSTLLNELEEAKEIQSALMPKSLPQLDGFDIAIAWNPARTVGGDYFDVMKLTDRRAGLCIADVAGKGMPAALLMSNVQAALKSFASAESSPAEVCARVNSVICNNIVAHRFITCFYALLDTETKTLTYANAGHCPPMLLRNDEYQRLTEGGPVLGVFGDPVYQQAEIQLQSGDQLVLFTDGITEASDASGVELGEQSLEQLLKTCSGHSAAETRDKIMAAVNELSAGKAYDDATLMIINVK